MGRGEGGGWGVVVIKVGWGLGGGVFLAGGGFRGPSGDLSGGDHVTWLCE